MSAQETEPRFGEVVLELGGLEVEFRTEDGVVRAVRGLSYALRRGETLGVVGESGSGKSVSHMALLGLLPPNARIDAQRLQVQDQQLLGRSESMFRKIRGRRIAMVFQDPDDRAQPLPDAGHADRRDAAAPPWAARPQEARGCDPGLGRGRDPGPGAPRRAVSARVLRRHAAARDDRDDARG